MQLSRRRSAIEYAVVAYEMFFMILAAYSFAVNPNTEVLQTFSRDLGIGLTNEMFAYGCAIGALISLSVLTVRRYDVQRYLYVVAATPILAYTIPVGYNAFANHRPGLGPIVYMAIYAPFVLLAFTTWRANGEPAADVSTNTDANPA